jgi:hypothetical protein
MRACWIALALLIAPAGVGAQPPGESLTGIFEAANVAGSRGDYASAISDYERLTQSGVHDPDVYFNLATSWAQSGDYSRAILNFEGQAEAVNADSLIDDVLQAVLGQH